GPPEGWLTPASLSLPLSVHLGEDGRQRACISDRKPSAIVMVQRDPARAHFAGIQADASSPGAKLRVILEPDHVDVEAAASSLQRLDHRIARRAGVLHEYRQTLRQAGIGDLRPPGWRRSELYGLKVGIELLPSGIVSALVGEKLRDAIPSAVRGSRCGLKMPSGPAIRRR